LNRIEGKQIMNEELKIKSKWPIWRKLLVGFLSITGVIIAVSMPGLFWQLHEANKSLHDFANALIAKDYSRAYGSTTPEFRAVTNYAAFVKLHEDLTLRMGELKNVEVDQSEVREHRDGWKANLDANMVFANGNLDFKFVLKKEDGLWKINSYQEQ